MNADSDYKKEYTCDHKKADLGQPQSKIDPICPENDLQDVNDYCTSVKTGLWENKSYNQATLAKGNPCLILLKGF